MKEQASRPVVAKLKTLSTLARELRTGGHFQITRLTVLKNWCEDPVAAGRFALCLAERSKHRTTKTCPGTKVDCRKVRLMVAELLKEK